MSNGNPKGNAGYRIARRSGPNRTWVTVYNAAEAEMTDESEWVVVCEAHGALLAVERRTDAESIMRSGSVEFCDQCRALVETRLAVADEDVHEQAARWRKVAHLLAALHKHGVPWHRAARLGRAQMRKVAKVAGVKPPSDITIKLLRETLRKIPQPENQD